MLFKLFLKQRRFIIEAPIRSFDEHVHTLHEGDIGSPCDAAIVREIRMKVVRQHLEAVRQRFHLQQNKHVALNNCKMAK